MKVIGINGSARKGWNTQTLVKKALEGAEDAGGNIKLIDLYDEPLRGCIECFACKRKGINTGGICTIKDSLRPLLEKAYNSDVVIIGSPNFFGYPSSMVRAFLERFLYPLTSYMIEDGKQTRILGKRIIPSGIIFTMNADENYYKMGGYGATLGMTRANMEYILGYAEQYNSYNTLQFNDYSVMNANLFNAEEKQKLHDIQFPKDEQACYEMGKRLVSKAIEINNN